jgi:hypothetical protein
MEKCRDRVFWFVRGPPPRFQPISPLLEGPEDRRGGEGGYRCGERISIKQSIPREQTIKD